MTLGILLFLSQWVKCKVKIVTSKIIAKSQILIFRYKTLSVFSLVFDYALKEKNSLKNYIHSACQERLLLQKTDHTLVDSNCAWNVFRAAGDRCQSCVRAKKYERN